VDEVATIHKSTFSVIGSTVTDIDEMFTVNLSTAQYEAAKWRLIKDMLDNDIEQYLVWPDTNPVNYPKAEDWQGWCLTIVNGNPVYVACY
jgi:hypothetical protein